MDKRPNRRPIPLNLCGHVPFSRTVPADPALTRRRQEALTRLGVLDRAGDPALSGLARVAAYVAGADHAAVHIFDDLFQHRVAAAGAPLGRHARTDAMCRVVVDGERRIVCPDAPRDERFGYSSFIRGDAPVRFYASLPLRTSDGLVVGTLCTWDEVPGDLTDTQLARLEDLAQQASIHLEISALAHDLGHAASHDGLTGVANRLVLCDRLSQSIARRLRHGGEILVAIIDIDQFKRINDVHGHEVGDTVLIEVARRLTRALRGEDTVARLGGDEFAVVAEVADEPTAELVLTRLRAGLGDVPLPRGATARASIGAALAELGDDVSAALERADRAMYAAKRGVSA